jgi:hypothetical protein
MPRRKPEQAEQIIPKLREVEVELGRGKTVAEAAKKIGMTEQTYYRWKKKFGGLRIDQRSAASHSSFPFCKMPPMKGSPISSRRAIDSGVRTSKSTGKGGRIASRNPRPRGPRHASRRE